MSAMVILVVFALILVCLPIFEGLLIRYTAKDRDQMLKLAEEMLNSSDYPDEQKDLMSDMLDTAVDRKFMVQVVVRFPHYVWSRISGKRRSSTLVLDDRFREFLRLHGRSVGAVNPVFDLIFRIEIAVFSIVFGFAVTGIVAASLLARVARKESGKLGDAPLRDGA